jgi:hypothetical protein
MDGHDVPMKSLVSTLRFDVQLTAEMEDTMPTFRDMTAEVLLLGGTKSPAYLRQILDTLSATMPHSKRILFSELDHSGPDNSGRPDLVAKELRHFFGESRSELAV